MAKDDSVMKKIKKRKEKFCKRRENLFKKARELSVLCEAEVAVILVSSDGKISEFASTNMDQILRRFNMCLKSQDYPTLKFIPEEPEEGIVMEEVDALRREEQEIKVKQKKLLGKDLAEMGVCELLMLQERLTKGLLCIKNRKLQLLEEELEKTEILGYQSLQRYQGLAEGLQGCVPPIFNPVPLSVYNPQTESITATHGPETDCNNEPSDKESNTTTIELRVLCINLLIWFNFLLSRLPPMVGSEMKTCEGEARSINPPAR